MKRLKTIVTLGAALLSGMMFAQAPAFVRGADVSWCTEMEASGKHFYNAAGEQTEMMTLLRQCGLEAVRLRVWVNPETAYGKWSDKADVLAKARRAKAQGLAVMIDFHYSDFFADPSRQSKPSAWASLSASALKQAVADHTKEVLEALKAEGIEPAWVQVGNETRSGMVWDDGRIDWSKSGSAAWAGYVALSNAGYDAVKSVLPNAKVIVHIDKGPEDNVWFFRDFKKYGGKFDMIGLSHYPESDWKNENAKTAANVKTLAAQFGVPVMIVETGYAASNETLAGQVMTDFVSRIKGLSQCAGVFYWEPEVYGWWKPEYYSRLGWNAYNKGAFTAEGRPSAALAPFFGPADAISAAQENAGASIRTYDIAGRTAAPRHHGLLIEVKGNKARKVLRR